MIELVSLTDTLILKFHYHFLNIFNISPNKAFGTSAITTPAPIEFKISLKTVYYQHSLRYS